MPRLKDNDILNLFQQYLGHINIGRKGQIKTVSSNLGYIGKDACLQQVQTQELEQ